MALSRRQVLLALAVSSCLVMLAMCQDAAATNSAAAASTNAAEPAKKKDHDKYDDHKDKYEKKDKYDDHKDKYDDHKDKYEHKDKHDKVRIGRQPPSLTVLGRSSQRAQTLGMQSNWFNYMFSCFQAPAGKCPE
jgi:hypothetical protein